MLKTKGLIFIIFVFCCVVFFGMKTAQMDGDSFYFCLGDEDGDWNNLLNWYTDEGCSVEAGAPPNDSDNVFVLAPIISNSGEEPTVNTLTFSDDTHSSISITVISRATFNGNSYNEGIITGDVTFKGSSYNTMYRLGSPEPSLGVIIGDVIFEENSYNEGTITGGVVFEDYGYNEGTITGDVTFNSYSNTDINLGVNNGTITGNVDFNNYSRNAGTITGRVFFNNFSYNDYGATITGNVTFNNDSYNDNHTTIDGNATFYNYSYNGFHTTINGNATFYNYSYNGYGLDGYHTTIDGNAIFYDYSCNKDMYATINGDAIFYDDSCNEGNITGNAIFNGVVNNKGVVEGDATFYSEHSIDYGHILGKATFRNATGGELVVPNGSVWKGSFSGNIVDGDEIPITHWIFNGNSSNEVTVVGNATFNDDSRNAGIIEGDATFNDTSYNEGYDNSSGIVTGNATFYGVVNNKGVVEGDATFYSEHSIDYGHIVGTATFSYATGGELVVPNGSVWKGAFSGNIVDGDEIPITHWVFNGNSYHHALNTLVGNVTFNDSSYNGWNAQIFGDATFTGTGSNWGSISGNKTYIFKNNQSVNHNFSHINPWTVIADGAVVNIYRASYNSETNFMTENGGSFVTTPQVVPSGDGSVVITPPISQVAIINSNQDVVVTIDDAITDPTLDISSIILGGEGILPQMIINSPGLNNFQVRIASSTRIISSNTNWTGIMMAPTMSTVTLPTTEGLIKTLVSAIKVGKLGGNISFDRGVRLMFPGQAGKKIGYSQEGAVFTEITNICSSDSQIDGDALPDDGDCKINVGPDLVVWTKHFTTFAVFTEEESVVLQPQVNTNSATNITQTSATLNGNIISDGGGTIIVSGFEYGTTVGYGSTTTDGYTKTLSSLTCNTTYHYRAYATNSAGTGYGADQSFITPSCSNNSNGESSVVSGGGGIHFLNYCSSITYSDWNTCSNNQQFRSVLAKFPSNCILTTEQQISLQQSCSGLKDEAALPIDISERPIVKPVTNPSSLISSILDESAIVRSANPADLFNALGIKQDISKELNAELKYKKILNSDKSLSAEEISTINRFIVYGTQTTQGLGEGERAGVINSYFQAYGKLLNSEEDWADALKIANGRWPSERSAKAESLAKKEFKKIYGRNANLKNNIDENAIMVISYGLLPQQRNLNSEKAAIRAFVWAHNRIPVSALDWNIVRAVAYSGAKR